MAGLEQCGSTENLTSVLNVAEKELYELLRILNDTSDTLVGPRPKDCCEEVGRSPESVLSLAHKIRSMVVDARALAANNLGNIGMQQMNKLAGDAPAMPPKVAWR